MDVHYGSKHPLVLAYRRGAIARTQLQLREWRPLPNRYFRSIVPAGCWKTVIYAVADSIYINLHSVNDIINLLCVNKLTYKCIIELVRKDIKLDAFLMPYIIYPYGYKTPIIDNTHLFFKVKMHIKYINSDRVVTSTYLKIYDEAPIVQKKDLKKAFYLAGVNGWNECRPNHFKPKNNKYIYKANTARKLNPGYYYWYGAPPDPLTQKLTDKHTYMLSKNIPRKK